MIISLIAVVDINMAIGYHGDQLVYISEDLKRFKALTTGHTIVMGRKTSQALPKGMLAKRRNIMMSRNTELKKEGVLVASSAQEVLQLCQCEDEVFIIGGGEIYNAFLPLAHRVYLTHIDHAFEHADTYFPVLQPTEWTKVVQHPELTDEKSGLSFWYCDYERVNNH